MARNEHGLTPQQEKFAQEMARGLPQAEAYRLAYPVSRNWKPESVWSKSSDLAADAKVKQRVSVLQEQAAAAAGLDATEVLRQVALIVTSDIANIYHPDGRLKMPHELDARTRAAVKSFKITKDGLEYQFWDKNSALDKAMKHLGLFDQDNAQKTTPLADLLKSLSGNVIGPVADDDTPNPKGEPEDDDD